MPGPCFSCAASRPPPFLSTSAARLRDLTRRSATTSLSVARCLPSATSLQKPSKQRWRFSCFRPDAFASENPDSESVEDKRLEKLEKHELDQSNTGKKNWFSSIHKVRDAIFRAKPWTVPWTVETILQVMLLWIASFWFVGSWIIPFLAHMGGFRKETLTYRGQALYSLLTDVVEGLAGIAILHRCLARFRPLPSDWFRFSFKGKWHFDVGLGCLMFPLVNRLSQVNLNLLPVLPSTPVTVSSVEQSIVARDPVAMALYAMVVSICAPIWEEIVFRGFLLPSLTKYMPVWCSILRWAGPGIIKGIDFFGRRSLCVTCSAKLASLYQQRISLMDSFWIIHC